MLWKYEIKGTSVPAMYYFSPENLNGLYWEQKTIFLKDNRHMFNSGTQGQREGKDILKDSLILSQKLSRLKLMHFVSKTLKNPRLQCQYCPRHRMNKDDWRQLRGSRGCSGKKSFEEKACRPILWRYSGLLCGKTVNRVIRCNSNFQNRKLKAYLCVCQILTSCETQNTANFYFGVKARSEGRGWVYPVSSLCDK